MSVRPIHLLGSATLRERAVEVGVVDDTVRHLVDDLFETMVAYKGVGLAANQVGIARRIAVVDTGDQHPIVLIDPLIIEREGADLEEEGCLSIPDIYGDVERATRVVVETTNRDGERLRVEAAELKARAVLHEIDHLEGILFLDRVSPLKRWMLLKKWQKQRKGKTGHLREAEPATAPE